MRSGGAGRGRTRLPAGSRLLRYVVSVVLAILLSACAEPAAPNAEGPAAPSDYPPSPDGIHMIALRFLEPGADHVALAVGLRPEDADYGEVFRPDRLADARTHYDGYWRKPHIVGPASDQTGVTIQSVTTEELLDRAGASAEFASAYRRVAPALAPGLRIYQIVFRRPGQTFGVVVGGFVHVNDKWRFVPAPWTVLDVNEPGHQH
jgi:hypothetical protein